MKIAPKIVVFIAIFSSAIAYAGGPTIPGKLKKPMLISHYAGGNLTCWSSGTKIVETSEKGGYTVFQYDENKERLWINVSGNQVSGDLVLGSDATCLFSGTRSSPLD